MLLRRPGPGATAASLAVLVVLVGLPLAGLVGAIVEPPPDPLGGQPTIASVLASSGVGELLLSSLGLSVVVAVLATGLGASLAWAEARLEFPGRRVLGVLALLPLAAPSYLLAAAVAHAFGPGGLFGGLGLPRPTGLPAAALVLVVVTAPYVHLVVGAALARGSAAEEEAARSLGAGPWRTFQVAVLPRLRPALGLSALVAALYAISDFGAVAVLDAPVLTWRLFQAVKAASLAKAAILGLATLGATVPLFIAARALRGGGVTGVANPRPVARRPAGPLGTGLAWLGFGGVVLFGVGLPLVTLGGWVLSGVQRDLAFASPWSPLVQTAGLSLLGAAVLVALVVVPARAVARGAPRSALVDEGVFVTSALPGVLLAFGLMLAALMVARLSASSGAVYGALLSSGVLLLLGYSARFAAESYAPVRAAFAGVDRRLYESARVLGVGSGRWLGRVELPLVAPGLAASLLLGTLAIVKELPVTLLLGGAMGVQTLAFRVWDRYREALWHDAGLSGLLLFGLALGLVAVTLKWRRSA